MCVFIRYGIYRMDSRIFILGALSVGSYVPLPHSHHGGVFLFPCSLARLASGLVQLVCFLPQSQNQPFLQGVSALQLEMGLNPDLALHVHFAAGALLLLGSFSREQ